MSLMSIQFFITFWKDIKDVFLKFISYSKTQKVIKHFAKTGCIKKIGFGNNSVSWI